jgi:hypothetical protein
MERRKVALSVDAANDEIEWIERADEQFFECSLHQGWLDRPGADVVLRLRRRYAKTPSQSTWRGDYASAGSIT